MNILIHSNNIYFNIGIAQCFRDIQKTAPELKVIHSLPLSHLPELSGLDVIILSLENYHDYLAAAEIAQHFQGLVIGFTSAGNVRRGRPFFADTLLWVSQREAVREVSRLLRCLAERRWPLVPRHQRQSVSFRQRAPLNRLEMRMIDATMKGQSVHQMAATLGINRKRVYNGLERIKVNFRLVSHSHFHHFMTDRLSFSRLSADFRCLTTAANATLPPRAASRLAENHSYYLKEFRKLF
ncbi:hypothetical protein ACPW99_10915 [Klebsiella pneumoniae]|uniref:Response regulator receiver protein n=4 Tax=Klebsiella pneumoniae TaxID=573 RepID=A0A5D3JXB5_KLEPN|nr:hypothetical protein [Klebsiella pneumoniae]KDL57958.1 hypothetical protein AF52_00859 [Klebsiella pneumoniae MGH 66]ALK11433.1 hypothetical protein KLP1_01880 [Klebsiella pneumoniae KP-1]ASC12061.1 hypothetical protein AM486_14960 [Klebsiella pneumoniae]ATQ88405.1 hypothetical protein CTI52_11380 [Klebsiella pneumoniae]ATQ93806.1 hypothetical protein CTI54_11385 [Klebsiella pneumoniae]